MATDIRVPTLGESVTEATIGKWFKKPGDAVKADEPLVELETDKVTLEVNAPASGVLSEITVKDGETVGVGALLGSISAGFGRRRRAAPAACRRTCPRSSAGCRRCPCARRLGQGRPARHAECSLREPHRRRDRASIPPVSRDPARMDA